MIASPQRLFWRLRDMSAREVVHRSLVLPSAYLRFVKARLHRDNSLARPELVAGEGLYSNPPLLRHTRQDLISVYMELFPDGIDQCVAEAERIVDHRFSIFQIKDYGFEGEIDWLRDPLTGKQWPLKFWRLIDTYDPEMGGIKYVWELNRHQHLTTLGRAFYLTDDPRYAREALEQMQHWIAANPPHLGVNWYSSLELAIRLISWTWTLMFLRGYTGMDKAAFGPILASMRIQSDFITHNLSLFSSANNHLIGEAAGLFVYGSSFPGLPEALRCRRIGARILAREMVRQFHPDGINREQAHHYTSFVLDLYMLAALTAGEEYRPLFDKLMPEARKWFEALGEFVSASGELVAMGDSDDGQAFYLGSARHGGSSHPSNITAALLADDADLLAPEPGLDERNFWLFGLDATRLYEHLSASAPRPRPTRLFQDGGYCISRDAGERTTVYIDCGPLGYPEMAPHGHADALSFILALDGEPALIDPGTYAYQDGGEFRRYFRSTAAHNTIRVDGEDQARQVGIFQWMSPVMSAMLDFRSAEDSDFFQGCHHGYRHLRDPVIHRRSFYHDKRQARLTILDTLEGGRRHGVEQFFHFAPDLEVHEEEGGVIIARRGDTRLILRTDPRLHLELRFGQRHPISGWCAPSFGVLLPIHTAVCAAETKLPLHLETEIRIERPDSAE